MTKHKSPQDLMAARNPFARKQIEPVDIYTPQVQVEVEGSEAMQEPVTSGSKNGQSSPKQSAPPTAAPKKHDTAKHYSTYLYPGQIKGIKLRAIEHDINDFAIVQEAIDEYFKKHPL